MKNILKPLIITLVAFLCVAILAAGLFFFSHNYSDIYNTPKNIDGVLTMKDAKLEDISISIHLNGEWDFFYNKWIIAENMADAQPDAKIHMPERWTGKVINGNKLSKNGYASYRMIVDDAKAGQYFVNTVFAPFAYRTYINGKLTVVNGEMSGIRASDKSNYEIYLYDAEEHERLELVIEVGENSLGGFFLTPRLDFYHSDIGVANFMGGISTIMFGIILAYVVLSFIINIGLNKKEKQLSFPFVMLAILIHFFTTKDFFWVICGFKPPCNFQTPTGIFQNYNYIIAYYLCFPTAIFMCAVLFIHLLKTKLIVPNRINLICYIALNAVCAIFYYILDGTRYQFIPVLCFICGLFYIIFELAKTYQEKRRFIMPYIIIILTIIVILTGEFADNLGLINFALDSAFSVLITAAMLFISLINFLRIRDNADGLLKAVVFESEMNIVKHQALKAQIKPHFVFNSLTSIQALYQKDVNAGSKALEKFARHLRLNVDSDQKESIPFDEELKNIMNYFELENLRCDNKLTLIMDIDYSDFSVPILTLQPLVENAVKYAETDKKEDGYIRISSKAEGGKIVVSVSDNGVGFDVDKIREGATGLQNITQRLKYALNANVKVESRLNEGTTVTIEIQALQGPIMKGRK